MTGATDVADRSRFGLGTASLAAASPRSELFTAVVRRANEAGIRRLDVAPMYVCGEAERLLGQALRELRGVADFSAPGGLGNQPPDSPIAVSTKAGRLIQPFGDEPAVHVPPEHTTRKGQRTVFDFSRAGVRRSYRESLDRIGLPRIDTLLLHDPDDHAERALAEAFPALLDLREEGRVGAVGIGTNRVELASTAVARLPLDEVLVAGRLTLLDQSAARLADLCLRRGIRLVVGGVFNSGLLADPDRAATVDYRAATTGELARARRLEALCRDHGVSLRTAALRFPLCHPAVTHVLLGPRTPEEFAELLRATTAEVPAELWEALAAEGVRVPGLGS